MNTAEQNPRPSDIQLPRGLLKKLPGWREQYGPELFYIQTCGGVVFRPFTRGELIRYEMSAVADPIISQQALLEGCVLDPPWESLKKNLALDEFGSVFRAVWKASGFRDPEIFETDLDVVRVLCQERDHTIIRMICQAFPKYCPDDIDKMHRGRILYLLAQAECVLGVTYDGREAAEVIGALVQKAQAEQHKELMRLKAAGHDVKTQRFFDWQADQGKIDTWERGTE